MTSHVQIDRKDGIQTLRFSRPDKLNAITPEMYGVISDALEQGDAADDIQVHVLLGSPGIFTAGNDISNFLAAGQDSGAGGNGKLATAEVVRFIMLLPRVSKPMIAAVDGPAVGIGTTLLFHFDLVYASDRSTFETPFLDLGLVPEAASSLTFPTRMGYARAFEMLVLGNRFDAKQMQQAGLLNAVVTSEDVEPTAMAAAKRLAAKPPEALKIARAMMRPDPDVLAERTKVEAIEFQKRLASPEARKAFQAFLAKAKT